MRIKRCNFELRWTLNKVNWGIIKFFNVLIDYIISKCDAAILSSKNTVSTVFQYLENTIAILKWQTMYHVMTTTTGILTMIFVRSFGSHIQSSNLEYVEKTLWHIFIILSSHAEALRIELRADSIDAWGKVQISMHLQLPFIFFLEALTFLHLKYSEQFQRDLNGKSWIFV